MVQNEGIAVDEQAAGIPTGAIVASAIAAGVVAYMVRRARRESKIETPASPAGVFVWQGIQPRRSRRYAEDRRRPRLLRESPRFKSSLPSAARN